MKDKPDNKPGNKPGNKPEKQRIIREQVKDLHTSHWDLDMLSREQLEALMSNPSTRSGPAAATPPEKARDESGQDGDEESGAE